MVDSIDLTMVNWARAQFALTAMYHWIFVPLTLGLSFLCAFFESIYVKTGNQEWRRLTQFWMKLFGINFAIGVATGIILEFEFGTNWSNYSWMVGDIFGAPLAIEGIVAFFLEATFFAVMFFGWDRVSERFHLFSTWMVAIGSNLSALWILIANGWMQYPVGQSFNPDSARFEMQSFFEVALSPIAISKFTHTTSSGFVTACLFVISVSCWFLLKKQHLVFARRSIIVASIFGLLSSIFVGITGDEAAYEVAQHQPMKLAAMEGLYHGERNAPLVVAGILNPHKVVGDNQKDYVFSIKVPGLLSYLGNRDIDSFIPGIFDLVYGNKKENIIGAEEKIEKGTIAVSQLAAFKKARKDQNSEQADLALKEFNTHKKYLGYGYLNDPKEAVPPIGITFYSFHIMVALGTMFVAIFLLFLFLSFKNRLENNQLILKGGLFLFLSGLLAGQAGWAVAEVGRQPWAIQGLLPVTIARSNLDTATVQITFFGFLILFTILLIAEIKIMTKQIQIGPEEK